MSGDDGGWASTSSPGIEEESVMHMLDWNKYRQQLVTGVGGLGKLNPDIVKGYTTLSRAGHLDEKTRLQSRLPCAATAASRCMPRRPGNAVRPRKRLPKYWAWPFPSMPARPWSIPPARSMHLTPQAELNPSV
jgi:hypothetical protein